MIKRNLSWLIGLILIVVWLSTLSDEQVAAQTDEFIGPDSCSSCHQEKYEEWRESKHAEAYSDPEFQLEWSEAGNRGDCLQCHTTGYDQDNQTYAYEGVTCEVCHGVGLTMEIDRSPELCGSCHTGEYGKNRYENYLVGTHYSSDVTCVDCHSYESDHDFEIQAQTCATCHTGERIHSSSLIPDALARASAAEEYASEIENELVDLEVELSEVEKRAEFITQLTLIGGGAILLVIIIVALSYLRQKRA